MPGLILLLRFKLEISTAYWVSITLLKNEILGKVAHILNHIQIERIKIFVKFLFIFSKRQLISVQCLRARDSIAVYYQKFIT